MRKEKRKKPLLSTIFTVVKVAELQILNIYIYQCKFTFGSCWMLILVPAIKTFILYKL